MPEEPRGAPSTNAPPLPAPDPLPDPLPEMVLVRRFRPPRCPNRRCPMHSAPKGRFFVRRGSYRADCRLEPVPRFKCRECKRGFSRQTFRLDYRDRRPECNRRVFECLVSGTGLRQTGRIVRLSSRGVQHKSRKIARVMRGLNRNLLRRLPSPEATYLFDEFETFEQSSILRLTVPVLIHRASLAILAVRVAPIRRVPRSGSAKRKWLDRVEREQGRRPDRSRAGVRAMLGRLRALLGGAAAQVITDEKGLYATELRRVLGTQVIHATVPSTRPRTVLNPLFPINFTEAMLRDNNGRLRWRSWLHSKHRRYLRSQLELFVAYRNWHRPRTNLDEQAASPGFALGLCQRAFTLSELLSWRQDWRDRSIHPTSADGSCAIGGSIRRRAS